MLNAFLFDFKKEISVIQSCKQLSAAEKLQAIVALLSLIVFIYALIKPCLLMMFVSITLLIITSNARKKPYRSTAGSQTKQSHRKNGQVPDNPKTTFSQMAWFQKKRVDVVRQMLADSSITLPKEKSIDLLIAECNEKLKERRNSEIATKRLKPLLSLLGIIFISLSTAYLYDKNIISQKIESSIFSLDWFSEVMQALASDIIFSETALPLFIVLCSYTIIFYLTSAFLIFPLSTRIVDRDWYLTEELRSILLYIRQENS